MTRDLWGSDIDNMGVMDPPRVALVMREVWDTDIGGGELCGGGSDVGVVVGEFDDTGIIPKEVLITQIYTMKAVTLVQWGCDEVDGAVILTWCCWGAWWCGW